MDLDLGGIFNQSIPFNYDDYEYKEDYLPERHHFEAVYIPFMFSLAMVVGLFGNGLLLVVLVLKRRSWSVTDTFILHLGVADCLLLVTLPFWAAQAAQDPGWSFGTPLCKITGAIFNINFYCGVFLLTCIGLDRYLSIVHSFPLFPSQKPLLAHASCLAVWLISLLLSIPDWIFLEVFKDDDQGRAECIHLYRLVSQPEGWLSSRLPYHVLGFFLPFVVLLFCFSCILWQVQQGSLGDQRQRALWVILWLVMVFFLFWAPYNITLLVDTIRGKAGKEDPSYGVRDTARTSLETSLIVTSALGCFHACLNPVLYYSLCGNFRKRVLGMLCSEKATRSDSRLCLWEFGVGEEPVPAQAQEKVVLQQNTDIEQQVQLNHN